MTEARFDYLEMVAKRPRVFDGVAESIEVHERCLTADEVQEISDGPRVHTYGDLEREYQRGAAYKLGERWITWLYGLLTGLGIAGSVVAWMRFLAAF